MRHTARYRRSPDEVTGWLFQRGYTMRRWRHGWQPADRIEPGTRNYLFCPPAPGRAAPVRLAGQRRRRPMKTAVPPTSLCASPAGD